MHRSIPRVVVSLALVTLCCLVLAAARTHRGLEHMTQIRLAVLERTGAISVIPEGGAHL